MVHIQRPLQNTDVLRLCNKHQFQIYKLCFSKIRKKELLHDVMQNIYIRLHTHFHQVCLLENPWAWLMRVAENECNDELRRLMRAEEGCKHFYHYFHSLVKRERKREQTAKHLNFLLEKIPPQYGTLVELHYLKGFSIAELSDISGCTRTAVSKRLLLSVDMIRRKTENLVKKS